MNKLTDSLKVIQALGWTKALSDEAYKAFCFLEKNANNLSDDELSDVEWEVVNHIEELLKSKTK